MKRVLVILAAVTTLWIPEYLWALDLVPDGSRWSCSHQVCIHVNVRHQVSPFTLRFF
jgi:hypothetical protein